MVFGYSFSLQQYVGSKLKVHKLRVVSQEWFYAMQTITDELLDIVDTRDRVLGSLSRGEIHRKGLMHRSVHVLVFDGGGSILLQKRSMEKDQCAGMWDSSCAGHVEAGQEYEITATRELQEELGIAPSGELKLLFKMSPTVSNGQEFAMVYSMMHEGPFVAAPDEIDELRWYTVAEVDNWVGVSTAADTSVEQDLTSGFIEIWNRYRNR